MKKEIADKWATALRSGEYKQQTGALANADRTQHCCLGVLCELAIEDGVDLNARPGAYGIAMFGGYPSVLPLVVREWSRVQTKNGILGTGRGSLMNLNDDGKTFSEIADTIEKYWEAL